MNDATGAQHMENETDDADALVRLKGDESDAFSFYGDQDDDGRAITQHRYYRWGDGCVVAVGELNFTNHWDDDAFDVKCSDLEAALTPGGVAKLREAMNRIADLGSCGNGKTPASKLLQQAIDIAAGAL